MKNRFLYSFLFFGITILIFSTLSFSLTISIYRPFENLTQNSDYDWLNLALPQIIYDLLYPNYDVAFNKPGTDLIVKGRFSPVQGGIELTLDITSVTKGRGIYSVVIGNPNDPLSMRDIVSQFFLERASLGKIPIVEYSRDALMAYYKGIYYKYIGEETYGDSSYPSQAPWKLAINYLREAVKVEPDFKEAYRELAFSFKETKWYAEEVKAWSFYLNLATLTEKKKVSLFVSEAYFNLAYSFYQKGRKDVALSYLIESINYNPKNIKAHYWLARIYYDLGKLKEAKAEWDTVIAMNPNYKSAKYFEEKVKKALKYGKEAYDYFEKGYLAYKRGDMDLAEDYINKAMELNYKFMDTYYWLGRINIERGRYKEALEYLKQGLEVDPSDKKIRYLIKLAKSKMK